MTNQVEMINGELVEMSDEDYAKFQTMQATSTISTAMQHLKFQAQTALDKSDMVATRCFKFGIDFPQEWKTHVAILRAVIMTGNGSIPNQPNYPENT